MSGKAAIAAAKRRRAGASAGNTSNYSQQQYNSNTKIQSQPSIGKIHINDAVKFLGNKFSELEQNILPSIVNETDTSIGVLTSNLESLKNYVLENNSSDEKLQDLENSITDLKLLILENKKQTTNNKNELALIKKQLNSLLDANLNSNVDESIVEDAVEDVNEDVRVNTVDKNEVEEVSGNDESSGKHTDEVEVDEVDVDENDNDQIQLEINEGEN